MSYTDEQLIGALRAFAKTERRSPTMDEWRARHMRPATTTLARRFGSWSKALDAAGLPTRPRGPSPGYGEKTAETEFALERLALGYSLGTVARELGITGQVLGRRIARYRAKRGLAPIAFSRKRRSAVELEPIQMADPLR